VSKIATLTVMGGLPEQAGQIFEVGSGTTTLGRGLSCDIQLPDQSISRLHAELVWEGEVLVLVHKSQVNRTRVNGAELEGRLPLTGGEEIQFADSVVLRIKIESDAAAESESPVEGSPPVKEPEPPSPPADTPPAASTKPRAAPAPEGSKPDSGSPSLPEPAPVPERPGEEASLEPVEKSAARPSAESGPPPDPASVRLAIIGAGPAGIAAAVRAAERGIQHVLFERSVFANTIVKYQKGKLVMAEPTQLPLQADLKVVFEEGVREQVLEWWSAAMAGVGAELVEACEILSIGGQKGAFEIQARDGGGARTIDATHIVLAIGVQGDLRKFGVPGDDQPWVTYQLDDPRDHEDKRVIVVGVGDAGIENALALAENGNEVTIVNRRDEIDRAKPMNRAAIEAKIKSGEINYLTNASADRFETDCAVFRTKDGAETRVDCDLVIGRLGATPPRTFLESVGVEFPSTDREAIPDVSESYESNVPGLYMVGALVGYPLIKNCLNQGFEVVEHILGEPVKPADEPVLAAKFRDVEGSVSDVLAQIQETVPTFGPLTSVQLRSLMFESKLRVEAPGTVIYRRADFDNTFFSILEGDVELIFLDISDPTIPEDLRQERRSSRGSGQFFGEDGLISGRRRGETVTTTSRCVLVETPRNAMTKLTRSVEDVKKVIDGAYINSALGTLFPTLASGTRKRMAYRAETLMYRAGEVLFNEGDEPDGLHLIRRGTVDLYKKHEGVEEQIDSIRAGSTIGEMAVIHEGRRRTATARASVDCETVCFPVDIILALVETESEVREYLERREQGFIIADVRRQHGRGTMMWLQKSGGKEATDLLMIDETLCIRCDNCEKACAETHGGVSRLNREAGATYMTTGGSALHLPTACQHCENPKCMTDCPPDALNRDPNGEVWINDETCIGCGNCETYCPYGVIKMAKVDNDPGPGLLMRLIFPKKAVKVDASAGEDAAIVKKAVKCDLCRELPKKRSGAARAACVASCPTGAIVRIDPDEYVDEIYERQG
jgi:Fe-S-cluster-containing dehydrogenase component/thioredoxin reductase/CRP-like cAMP-binding protein/pSer/pThr/pTyr-binding forkhead associated (FHA) protein